jgi:hypothetical protein
MNSSLVSSTLSSLVSSRVFHFPYSSFDSQMPKRARLYWWATVWSDRTLGSCSSEHWMSLTNSLKGFGRSLTRIKMGVVL